MTSIRLLRITKTSFNTLKQRVVKMIGAKSTLTAEEYGPAGIDSNPLPGMTAMYTPTERDGDEAVIAYLVKNKLAEPGETRVFSTDADGQLQAYLWLKSAGNIMELNGNEDNAVLFNKMKIEFNLLKTTVNALVSIFNAHTHPYMDSGTPSTTSATLTPGTANNSNIDNAKNTKIKTNA